MIDLDEVRVMRKKEILECPFCKEHEGQMAPMHFSSSRCESNGRRWDEEKQEMIGNSHCSCDWCF